MSLVLVGGGARSGKSRHALQLARQCGHRLGFIATAAPGDDEMRSRIALHQRERGPDFTTFEEPLAVASLIRTQAAALDAIVVDCLTLWLSNHMFAGANLETAAEELLDAATAAPSTIILVTNEVGCGIVPDNALAREYRDQAGKLNQQVAQQAAAFYWMAFGIPLKVK